jgi:hypothetical protein
MLPGGADMIGSQRRCLQRCNRLQQFRPEYRRGWMVRAEGAGLGPDSGKP